MNINIIRVIVAQKICICTYVQKRVRRNNDKLEDLINEDSSIKRGVTMHCLFSPNNPSFRKRIIQKISN